MATGHYSLKIFDWTRVDGGSRRPTPRRHHHTVSTDTDLYVVGGNTLGGRERDEVVTRQIWRFNFVEGRWTKIRSNMPKLATTSPDLLTGSTLFLSAYDRAKCRWTGTSLWTARLPKNGSNRLTFERLRQQPFHLMGGHMLIEGGNVYSVGPIGGVMHVFMLEPESRHWERVSQNFDIGPEVRAQHRIISHAGKVYLFGGGVGIEPTFTFETIPTFDVNTRTWETLTAIGDSDDPERFPTGRKRFGCVQDPHDPCTVYISGGCKEGFQDGEILLDVYDDVWRIDLNTLKWKRMKSFNLPYGVCSHAVSTTPDGRMCVFGGATGMTENKPDLTGDLHVSWITIPKLADACWDAVLYYIRNGTIVLPKDVRSLGLPARYTSLLKSSGLVSDATYYR